MVITDGAFLSRAAPLRFATVRVITFMLVGLIAPAALAVEGRPLVVTSFLPLYCWTINVAGDHAHVENLLPGQSEPHDYSLTPNDARKLHSAELLIVNGLGIESWLPKWRRNEGSRAADKLVDISAGLGLHHGNPHVWLDPVLSCIAVSNIAAALQRIDPPHASAYASNAVAYTARLQRLDAEIRQTLAPLTNCVIVTYHDAFPYFAARYGLEVAGVVEQVPDVNPTPKYLARLGAMIRARGVRSIFIAPNSSSRLARQIAEDLSVRLIELNTLETGALTAQTYEEGMRENAVVLRSSLQ